MSTGLEEFDGDALTKSDVKDLYSRGGKGNIRFDSYSIAEQLYGNGGEKGRHAALKAYEIAIEEKEDLNKLAFLAAAYAHAEALSLLFDAGVSSTITNNNGYTLLHILAQPLTNFSSYEKPVGAVAATTSLLLDNGCDPLQKGRGGNNWTCYHYAAQNALLEFVEVLAHRGVDLNLPDKTGKNAIHIACNYVKEYRLPYFRVIKTLIEAGVDPNEKNRSNESALDVVAEKFFYSIGREAALNGYKTLLSKELNEPVLNGLAFIAADYAHAEALSLLFNAGVSPAITDSNASTLLHALAKQHRSGTHEKPAGAVAATANLLLDSGVSALRKEKAGDSWTCYHYAAQNGMAEFMEVLAKHGAKLGLTDKNGNNGIHIACENTPNAIKKIDETKKKIEKATEHYNRIKSTQDLSDEEIWARYSGDSSPKAQKAHEAAIQLFEDYFRLIKVFVEAGVDPNEKNGKDKSALDLAVKNNLKDIGAFLSGASAGDNDEAAIVGGMTLHQATAKSDAEAIKAIISAGADPDSLLNIVIPEDKKFAARNIFNREGIPYNFDGCTALTMAVCLLHVDAVKALLDCGADPSFKDGRGKTAISYFFTYGFMHYSTSKLMSHLFDHGFKTRYSDIFKENLIQKVINVTLGSAFNIDTLVDNDENTLFILACRYNCKNSSFGLKVKTAVIDEVLKHKPNFNLTNRFGETALMHCCAADFEVMENVQLTLLEGGADATTTSQNGETALHYAARNEHKSGAKILCDMLLEFGADANAVNNEGKTALDIATKNNNESLVKLLLTKM